MSTLATNRQHATSRQNQKQTISIAYTPDSDDAFNFYAWEHEKVRLSECTGSFHRDHIIALNHAAAAESYDVVAISSVMYPTVADRYWVMSIGNSVGRGYGPVLVSKKYRTIDELRGKRIAVAGIPTTGGALAMMFVPNGSFHEMQYDKIADAVASGEYDAGVMIHEELLFFPEKGLQKVADLGATWTEDTGLPLPVGLNLVRKGLGRPLAQDIANACYRSLQWGMEHFDEAFAYASTFGRGCAEDHVAMFSNEDTLCLPVDVRQAMAVMFDRVASMGLGPKLESFEIVDAGNQHA